MNLTRHVVAETRPPGQSGGETLKRPILRAASLWSLMAESRWSLLTTRVFGHED